MATCRRYGRRLHATGTAAGNQNATLLRGRLQGTVGEFAAGLRMLDAGDRVAHVEMADTGLIAGDAGADVIELASLGLARHLRIADQRPGHADHIGLAAGDDLVTILRLVDA